MTGQEAAQAGEVIDVEAIMEAIPHRYPILLVDRILEWEPSTRAVGLKNVSINEPYFQGHFPGKPIMPGVLIIEAMAQTAGVLVVESLNLRGKGTLVYFMGIDNAKFRRPVTPGDQLHLEVVKERGRGNVWVFKGKATVDGKVVAQADFMAMLVDPEDA
ncbi:MAG: 3-hydroxyacyl-ACP dehydratase FabZ [Alphaproteobacteria bacterium]